jgi:DNA-binding helix-turn-helix protein
MNNKDERIRIGNRISEIRKEKQITIQQMAIKCDLKECHIARIEKGKYNIGIDILAKIASVLGKRIDFV